MIQSVNPATGEVLETLDPMHDAAVAEAASAAAGAQEAWSRTSLEERGALLHAVADARRPASR